MDFKDSATAKDKVEATDFGNFNYGVIGRRSDKILRRCSERVDTQYCLQTAVASQVLQGLPVTATSREINITSGKAFGGTIIYIKRSKKYLQ